MEAPCDCDIPFAAVEGFISSVLLIGATSAQWRWRRESRAGRHSAGEGGVIPEGRRMLHELLLALVGCTGDVFMDVKEQAVALGLSMPKKTRPRVAADVDNDGEADSDVSESIADECTFRVAPDITFLKDSER